MYKYETHLHTYPVSGCAHCFVRENLEFYKEKGYFRLQPENDYMEPIILDSVTILGKAVGLYRKF